MSAINTQKGLGILCALKKLEHDLFLIPAQDSFNIRSLLSSVMTSSVVYCEYCAMEKKFVYRITYLNISCLQTLVIFRMDVEDDAP